MSKYPDGITRMADYIGCVVELKEDLTLRGGSVLESGRLFVVKSHHRGRLTLYHPGGGLAAIAVDRYSVRIIQKAK